MALRLVEAGGRLVLAEDVRDAVVADAVAGTEVGVRVVVEGAPADASSVLRIGGKLIVNARMAERVFALPLVVIGGLGGVGVADELRVEVARMIRLSQRESKVVDGEDILEKLGLFEVTDAACLTRRIESVREGVSASVKVVIVWRLVDTDAPQDDRWMIPVAANHAAYIVDGELLPRFRADVLPARNLFQDKKSNLIAAIEEMAGLRIVRGPHDVAVQAGAQDVCVLALHAGWHRLADERKSLVAIEPAQFEDLSVEREPVIGERRLSETDAPGILIDGLVRAEQPDVHGVEIGMFELPELDAFEVGEGEGVLRWIWVVSVLA